MLLKKAAIAGVVAALALTLTACGNKEDGKVTTTTKPVQTSHKITTTAAVTTTKQETTRESLSEKLSEGLTELKSEAEKIME